MVIAMKTIIKILAMLLLIQSAALGQLRIEYSTVKVLAGLVDARQIDNKILIGEASEPKTSQAALIVVETQSKFVKVKARKSLFESAEISKLSATEYLLVGVGKYAVEVTTFDPELGIDDAAIEVFLGDPQPPIPPPDPKPPVPPPTPINVPNEYNVGATSYSNAPKDEETASKIAGWYRIGASKLFGGGGLADIGTILRQIDKQFTEKTCRDRETCEKWDRWKLAVSAALTAEQTKRKTFSRQDWYTALVEVATSLEAVNE
jgi:hypothetical protein